MIYLATDEQTITDLGIFGRRDENGIYDLYNRTYTRGGEVLLKELFHAPLSDREEINRRSQLIAHFAALQTRFPFDISQLDMAEKYLHHAEAQTKNTGQQGVLGEKEVQQGVTAVIALIQRIRQFIETPEVASIKTFEQERKVITLLVGEPALVPALKEQLKGKLPYTAIAAYDALFRLQQYPAVRAILTQIYYLDVYLSTARLAAERGWVFPRALEKGGSVLRLEGVYHPELTRPVSNDVFMDADRHVIFLTGANMAGKSTFLRSVSTALYIAHIGFPVAARSMEFSVLDGIYTTINLPDNLGIGASHFYSEVLRVKKVAAELHQGKSLYVVFDEMFRGTNVKDAHEATVEVTGGFAGRGNSLFIISSHIVEAGEDLRKEAGIRFQYLPTRMKGYVPSYTYTLEEGITDDRHGMIIIRNEGILELLQRGRKAKTALI